MSEAVVTGAAAQRTALEIDALVAKSAVVGGAHGLIWVRGADAVSFLDALISQAIAPAKAGSVRSSFLLTPQGKMRALLWVLRSSDEEVGLVTQASTVDTVVEDLTRFLFRVDAAIERDPRPVLTLVGAQAERTLVAADVARPGADWLRTEDGLVAAVPFAMVALPRFVVVGDAVGAIAEFSTDAGMAAYEAVRIGAGEPVGNVDFDDSTIAHELGPVADSVDFTKGCYLGQELIARIDSRGRVTKRLRAVTSPRHVDLGAAELTAEGRAVGSVTSSATDPVGAGTIGLALIHHEIEVGTELNATTPNGESKNVVVGELPVLGR